MTTRFRLRALGPIEQRIADLLTMIIPGMG